MHAYLLTHYGPNGLQHGTAPEQPPASGEVTIRVDAIAVNPLDWKIRHGWLAQMIPLALPAVIGSEGAGTILEIGPDVVDFAVGDRVTGFIDSGAFAEIAVTRAARLVPLPAGLSMAQAAALPTAAETATRMLALLRPEPASTVVVNGAAGAVGSMLTQLLARGGHRVIGTASAANHDYIRSLGATPISTGPNWSTTSDAMQARASMPATTRPGTDSSTASPSSSTRTASSRSPTSQQEPRVRSSRAATRRS